MGREPKRRKQDTSRPVAVVFRLGDFPCAKLLLDVAALPASLLSIVGYTHVLDADEKNTLFDRLPERELEGVDPVAFTAVFDTLTKDERRFEALLFDDGGPGSEWQWGTHLNASLADVIASFEADGFRVKQLSESFEETWAEDKARSPKESMAAFDDGFPLDGEDAPEYPAQLAVRTFVAKGGPLPSSQQLEVLYENTAERALNPCIEQWNAIDERLFELWCRVSKDPGSLTLSQPERSGDERDRHRLLREKFAARGITELAVRDGLLRALTKNNGRDADPCWPSSLFWLASMHERLAELQAVVNAACGEHEQPDWLLTSLVQVVPLPPVVESVRALIVEGNAARSSVLLALLGADAEAHASFVRERLPRLAALADPSERFLVARKLVELEEAVGEGADQAVLLDAVEDCLLRRPRACRRLEEVASEAFVRFPAVGSEFLARWVASPRRYDTIALVMSAASRLEPSAMPGPERERLERAVANEPDRGVVAALGKLLSAQGSALEPTVAIAIDPDDAAKVRTALTALDTFIEALPTALEWHGSTVEPEDEITLSAFEQKTKRVLSPGARAFFRHPRRRGSIVDPRGDLCAILETTTIDQLTNLMEWWPSTDEPSDEPSMLINEDQRRHGVPLWEEENTIVVDGRTGVVSRADGEGGPGDVIAASLGEFLTHFVAAGCFSYGAAERARFERYWEEVKHLVPFAIAPKDNRWLQHLDRWYRGDITT